jgi:hypothetical protein
MGWGEVGRDGNGVWHGVWVGWHGAVGLGRQGSFATSSQFTVHSSTVSRGNIVKMAPKQIRKSRSPQWLAFNKRRAEEHHVANHELEFVVGACSEGLRIQGRPWRPGPTKGPLSISDFWTAQLFISLCGTLYFSPPRTGPPRRLSTLQRTTAAQASTV